METSELKDADLACHYIFGDKGYETSQVNIPVRFFILEHADLQRTALHQQKLGNRK